MKKSVISIQFGQEKLRALNYYVGKKETTLEAELDDFMEKLYEKYVPAQTREYIESVAAEEDKPQPRSPRRARLAARDDRSADDSQHNDSGHFSLEEET